MQNLLLGLWNSRYARHWRQKEKKVSISTKPSDPSDTAGFQAHIITLSWPDLCRLVESHVDWQYTHKEKSFTNPLRFYTIKINHCIADDPTWRSHLMLWMWVCVCTCYILGTKSAFYLQSETFCLVLKTWNACLKVDFKSVVRVGFRFGLGQGVNVIDQEQPDVNEHGKREPGA